LRKASWGFILWRSHFGLPCPSRPGSPTPLSIQSEAGASQSKDGSAVGEFDAEHLKGVGEAKSGSGSKKDRIRQQWPFLVFRRMISG
jgi:hypothetical protein